MEFLPTNIAGWVTLVGTFAGGIYSGFTVFSKSARDIQATQTQAAKDTIDLLSKQVDVLEKNDKKREQDLILRDKEYKELLVKVSTVEGENKTLRALLTGNDTASLEYKKRAENAMVQAQETHEMVKALVNSAKVTNESIEKMIKVITEHQKIELEMLNKVPGKVGN